MGAERMRPIEVMGREVIPAISEVRVSRPVAGAASPTLSLQELYAPAGRCFGCGPANPHGLHVASHPDPDDPDLVVAEWRPDRDHEAFEGVVNGGILGTLLDRHANWTAAWHLMRVRGLDRPPTTVTLEFAIRFRRPTPSDQPVTLRARVVESGDDLARFAARVANMTSYWPGFRSRCRRFIKYLVPSVSAAPSRENSAPQRPEITEPLWHK
jgi:acyl-coenzyme A thioesterase PaaI-like protein